jgi:hypothetical protein
MASARCTGEVQLVAAAVGREVIERWCRCILRKPRLSEEMQYHDGGEHVAIHPCILCALRLS